MIAEEYGYTLNGYELVKHKVILTILYDIIKDFDKKLEGKNQRILTIKAYFELVHMKNKFLCHSSLTRLS